MSKNKMKNNSQGLAIQELLAAPFVAAASANSAMAKKQTSFLMDTCFDLKNGDDGEDVYYPKMIKMKLIRHVMVPDPNGGDTPLLEKIETDFQIPLLTLIPFNSLSVKEVNVKFDLEIISQESSQTVSSKKNKKGNKKGTKDEEEVSLKGAVSYDSSQKTENQYQRRNASKLSVEMNAGQLPLPVGFTTLLDLYTKNISPQAVEKK